jgi:cytochrome bd-type quinol oxidase subunit 2
MHTHTIGYLVAIVVYALLTLMGAVLTVMYHHAYLEMKRTPMIKSVWVLMLAITLDSLFFTMATTAAAFHHPLNGILTTPQWLIIPKTIFLVGLFCFMVATLSPSKPEEKKVRELQEASDRSTLRR